MLAEINKRADLGDILSLSVPLSHTYVIHMRVKYAYAYTHA